MNSLKTVFVVIVLAVLAGAVYVLVNDNASHMPPAEIADGWSDSTDVQLPESPSLEAPFGPPGGASADASMATSRGMAPPFSPETPSFDASAGGTAPPFAPPDAADNRTGPASFPTADLGLPQSTPPGFDTAAVRSEFGVYLAGSIGKLEQDRFFCARLHAVPGMFVKQLIHKGTEDIDDFREEMRKQIPTWLTRTASAQFPP